MDKVIPEDQIIYRSEIYQRFKYISDDPKIYLTRFVNLFLRAFTQNINNYSSKVIDLNPFFTNYNNGQISFIIQPGVCIVDTTLVEISDIISLDIDLTGYESYSDIIIYAGYKFGTTDICKVQLGLLNLVTNDLHSEDQSLFEQDYSCVILGRFRLIRDDQNKLIRIYHPYGQFIINSYLEFLRSIDSNIEFNSDTGIYDNLYQSVDLYKPFFIQNKEYQLLPTVFVNKDSNESLLGYVDNKLNRRYLIPSIDNYYYHKFDRRIKVRTELFNDEYSYAL